MAEADAREQSLDISFVEVDLRELEFEDEFDIAKR